MSAARLPRVITLEPRVLLAVAPVDLPTSFSIGPTYDMDVRAVATDRDGNMFITGITDYRADFDLRPGADQVYYAPRDAGSTWDPYVAKIAPDGRCLWVKVIDATEAGGDLTSFQSIATDGYGNYGDAFLVGSLRGTIDFDPGPGTYPLSAPAGGMDAVILRLSADGEFVYARQVGSLTPDQSYASTVLVGGGLAAYTAVTNNDARVTTLTKLAPEGDVIHTRAIGKAVPGSSLVLGFGHFGRLTLVTGGPTLQVLRFSSSRSENFETRLGAAAPRPTPLGLGVIRPVSMDVDEAGNLLLTGTFTGAFDFAPGKAMNYVLHPKGDSGHENVFVAKYTAGGALAFAFAMGNAATDRPAGARFDRSNGDVLVGGSFRNKVDFNPSRNGAFVLDAGDDNVDEIADSDLFVARYSAGGRFRSASAFDTPLGDVLANGVGLVADDRLVVIANNYDADREQRWMYLFQPALIP